MLQVLLWIEPGDPELSRALAGGALRLCSLPQRSRAGSTGALGPHEAALLPYLRPTRIPAETYPGQSEMKEITRKRARVRAKAATADPLP